MIERSVSAHQETVNKFVGCFFGNMLFNQHRQVNSPAKRNRSVIQIEKPVGIAETVLGNYDVFDFVADESHEDAPAFDWHIDGHA